jgi:hypothetical protein
LWPFDWKVFSQIPALAGIADPYSTEGEMRLTNRIELRTVSAS